MNTADVLRAAAERISGRGAWVKGALAEDASGNYVFPTTYTACRWCAIGAIHSLTSDTFLRRDAQAAAEALIEGCLADYNDAPGRRKQSVVALLRRAADEWDQATVEMRDAGEL